MTRQGRLPNLAVLREARPSTASSQVQLIEGLLDVVSRSRLDRRRSRLPAAATACCWLVEHATVRATKQPPLDVPLPPKKRAASLTARVRIAPRVTLG